LSDGARIAANIANTRPDRIHTVGLFSPVVYKKQLPKNTGQSYIVYVGKNDFFKPNGKRFHRRMTKAGYPHQYIETQGGHDWPVWRKCLSDFLTHL
jgi:enterochelin esterase-like enzyme